jgi:hypothetical protein
MATSIWLRSVLIVHGLVALGVGLLFLLWPTAVSEQYQLAPCPIWTPPSPLIASGRGRDYDRQLIRSVITAPTLRTRAIQPWLKRPGVSAAVTWICTPSTKIRAWPASSWSSTARWNGRRCCGRGGCTASFSLKPSSASRNCRPRISKSSTSVP